MLVRKERKEKIGSDYRVQYMDAGSEEYLDPYKGNSIPLFITHFS